MNYSKEEVEKLKKLHSSFEDVNHHSESKPLWEAIQFLKEGVDHKAEEKLKEFHAKLKED